VAGVLGIRWQRQEMRLSKTGGSWYLKIFQLPSKVAVGRAQTTLRMMDFF
jgi:hypothetical protein